MKALLCVLFMLGASVASAQVVPLWQYPLHYTPSYGPYIPVDRYPPRRPLNVYIIDGNSGYGHYYARPYYSRPYYSRQYGW